MRLLFDHSLSPHLVVLLSDLFPDASHVYSVSLERSTDDAIWNYAREHEYTIVSRDADFSELSVLRGFPPKVIWIRSGNCTTSDIEKLIRQHSAAIQDLNKDPNSGVLSLF